MRCVTKTIRALELYQADALVSHAEGQYRWHPSHPAVEMANWFFIELEKERWPGMMVTTPSSSVQQTKVKYEH